MEGRKLNDHSDKDLVVAFKQGDRDAYDEIYTRYSARVRGICRRMLGNSADAEEATQETFLRSYKALHRFNGQYQLSAWLSRIASNICVDHLRQRSRHPEITVETEDDDRESPGHAPDQLVTDQIRLTETLQEIQPLHAEVLMMRAVGGLSHVEMADELDMTPQQVKSLLHRARTSFRRAWQHASGFIAAPWLALRSVANRSREPQIQNLAGAAPMTAITAERVAASAVAAVLAISGLSSSGSSGTDQWPIDDVPRPPISAAAAGLPPQETRDQIAVEEPVQTEDEPLAPIDEVTEILEEALALAPEKKDPPKQEPEPEPGPVQPPATSANDTVDEVKGEADDTIDKVTDRL